VVTHDQEEAMAMADRIAVMYDGRIDQLGGPSEIYDHPATPFVADFIGDMNHLEGTLARDGERLVCDVGGTRFGIGLVVEEAEIGRRVRIGVRPEELHARAGAAEGTEATVQTAMVLGHDLQVVARLEGGAEVMARQPRTGDDGVSAVMPGEKVRLSWSPTAALLLGPADTDRPASATPEPLELPA
jgi:spermidine/putrescine transport system ATP-binding protein